tara:strand:+ start:1439 stop:2518 length:1080 start_codon:yes stop_codon:yes gene_type:complete
MKNVKNILMFITVSAFLFSSAQRVNSLGGNVGYWAGDDNEWTMFPHTLNNSNLAQVAGLGTESAHEAYVRWGEGTKWGFSWNQANANDMLNLQWGNGTMGATFGFGMASYDDGIAKGDDTCTPSASNDCVDATSSMGLNASFGMAMGFGDLGVGFYQNSGDDGTGATDQAAAMGFWANIRRAQNLWVFDNMLAGFSFGSDNNTGASVSADAETNMSLTTSFFTHLDIADGTTGLLAMGFGYYANAALDGVKDATETTIVLPSWTFAVESGMTDWATCRVGLTSAYVLSNTVNSGLADAKDVTNSGTNTTNWSVGLGFNYGSFNLDLDVEEDLFTNPVQHVTGYEPISGDNATATLTYTW